MCKQKLSNPMGTQWEHNGNTLGTWKGNIFTLILFHINWLGCLTSPTFCFCNEPIWLAHRKQKLRLWWLPQNRRFYIGVPTFGPPIYVRRGGLWAKHMGLKRGAIRNTLGEHIENPLGTWKEHVGTKWKMKNIPPLPPQNLKGKKSRHFESACWAFPSHWLHEISISKTVGHPSFGLG